MCIDLHSHTVLSDASCSPEELILIGKAMGIKALAITDHDTFNGYYQGKALADKLGINLILGCEISTYDPIRRRRCHILCYNPRTTDLLQPILDETLLKRRQAMLVSIEKAIKAYPIPEEMIFNRAKASTCLYKQHVIKAYMDCGFTTEMFGSFYKELFDSRNGLAYVRVEYPDIYMVIDLIHKSGGTAVMAHPTEYRSMELLEELCEKNLIDGIELNHPRNSREDFEKIKTLGQRYNKILTGGTDFHGSFTTVPRPIGTFTTELNEFNKIIKTKEK